MTNFAGCRGNYLILAEASAEHANLHRRSRTLCTTEPTTFVILGRPRLIIPTAIEKDLFDEFLRVRDTWPNQNVEIKGSSLDESQAAQLISLLLRYDTLVQFIALDANTHPDPVVEDFKNRQADAVTANIIRDHHPGPILHLHQLGEAVRAMQNQLFLQAFATWKLIIKNDSGRNVLLCPTPASGVGRHRLGYRSQGQNDHPNGGYVEHVNPSAK